MNTQNSNTPPLKRLAWAHFLQSTLLFALITITTASTSLVLYRTSSLYTSQHASHHTAQDPQLQARTQLQHIAQSIRYHRAKHTSLPHTLPEVTRSKYSILSTHDLIDPWGKPYAITARTPSSVTLRSPGPDRVALTHDDLTLKASFAPLQTPKLTAPAHPENTHATPHIATP